jgi:plasmid stabilization system protein ParE
VYIRVDSYQNADTVKQRLLNKINELAKYKTVHRKDSYKKNNDGNFLYFEILKYRVVYYAQPNEVFIIRVRHTSMEPKKY